MENHIETVRKSVAADVTKESFAYAQDHVAHQLHRANLEEKFLLPGAAKAEITAIERTGNLDLSPDELLALGDRLSRLRRINENEVIQTEAIRGLNGKFPRQSFDNLADVVDKSFANQIAELEAKEAAFFAMFGLPAERTSVTKLIEAERNRFTAMADSYRGICRAMAARPTAQNIADFDFSNLAFLFANQEKFEAIVAAEQNEVENQNVI